MKGNRNIFLLLLLPLLYASCIMEESVTPVEQKPQDIQIDLKVADTRLPGTRAISMVSENQVSDLYMVIYDSIGQYRKYKKATKITNKNTTGDIKTATFQLNSQKELDSLKNVRLRFFANMDTTGITTSFVTALKAQTGSTEDEICDFAPQEFSMPTTGWKATADSSYTPMPMWGGMVDALSNRNDEGVTLTEGPNTGLQAELMRATARINVMLKDSSALKITSIDLYKIQKKGYVNVPFSALDGSQYNASAPYEGSLTSSTTGTLTYNLSTPDYAYRNSIYVPETKNSATDSITMVVGITDGTDTRYSRVDFVDGNKNLISLVRNHTYEITLAFNPKNQLVGYTTKANALLYRTENLTYDFDVINDKYLNVMVTDGKYLLTMSQDDFTVKLTGGTVDFVVCTPPYMNTGACTGWYIDPEEIKVNGIAVGTGGDSGIDIYKRDDPTVSTWSGNKGYNYYLTIKVPAKTADTEYEMYLRCTDKFYWTLKVHQHD